MTYIGIERILKKVVVVCVLQAANAFFMIIMTPEEFYKKLSQQGFELTDTQKKAI